MGLRCVISAANNSYYSFNSANTGPACQQRCVRMFCQRIQYVYEPERDFLVLQREYIYFICPTPVYCAYIVFILSTSLLLFNWLHNVFRLLFLFVSLFYCSFVCITLIFITTPATRYFRRWKCHFGPDWNMSTFIGWIVNRLCRDVNESFFDIFL